MNELKLVIELSPADRELISGLIGAVSNREQTPAVKPVAEAPKAKKTTAKKPSKAEAEAAVAQAATKVVTEEPKPEEAPQLPIDNSETLPWDDPKPQPEAAKPVELSELQKAITTFCVANPGKKPAVRELVKQYGANVSGIPADKRAEVMNKLASL